MGTRNNVIAIESRLAKPSRPDTAADQCRHRWLVATPQGTATSLGVCRRCGRKKRFANALEDILKSEGRWMAGPW
ncbi:MAG: hypothetical protein WEE64_03225 [Dehalococcoidia bacterium]